jgi:hypothetical protein
LNCGYTPRPLQGTPRFSPALKAAAARASQLVVVAVLLWSEDQISKRNGRANR